MFRNRSFEKPLLLTKENSKKEKNLKNVLIKKKNDKNVCIDIMWSRRAEECLAYQL